MNRKEMIAELKINDAWLDERKKEGYIDTEEDANCTKNEEVKG